MLVNTTSMQAALNIKWVQLAQRYLGIRYSLTVGIWNRCTATAERDAD